MLQIAIIFLSLFILEVLYFKVADYFNIIDKPSERGSSKFITLRGGGIIFYIGALIWFIFYGREYWLFFTGLSMVSILSFVDDIHSLSARLRLPLQFIGMLLLLFQLILGNNSIIDINSSGFFTIVLILVLGLVICTGAMNVFNFMDGINGITGGYSLIVLSAILFILDKETLLGQSSEVETIVSLLKIVLSAALVFCFFNFRSRAKCFAGDVGSVSIAFIILFTLGYIVINTGDLSWLSFLVVYGVDGCLTILHRIMLRENISQPHRKHLFQIMANELKIPHVIVSLVYMAVQLLCCIWYIIYPGYLTLLFQIIILSIIYILFMRKFFKLHQR